MVTLFSYGTLQDSSVQFATFGRFLIGHSDSLLGYCHSDLRIGEPSVVQISGKARHPVALRSNDPWDEIEGTAFDITHDELLLADKYEVADYKRVYVRLKSGTEAWVYVDARSA